MSEIIWAWAIVGLVMLVAEIMVAGTLYALWFGIAAFCMAGLMWLIPELPYAVQFIIFAVLSLGSLAIWRRYYKKTDVNYRVGQAQGEEIGRVGLVMTATSPSQNGTIRFTQGLMGSREWAAISDEPIAAGCQATVVAVEGNMLRIAKTQYDEEGV